MRVRVKVGRLTSRRRRSSAGEQLTLGRNLDCGIAVIRAVEEAGEAVLDAGRERGVGFRG